MFTPRGEHSLLFKRMEGQTEFHPQGTKFAPVGQLRPWGSYFAPRGEVKNGPQDWVLNESNFEPVRDKKMFPRMICFTLERVWKPRIAII
jgi:hypothetical protein